MSETWRTVVEFLAGPLDGWIADQTLDHSLDLPQEWWPRWHRNGGYYSLSQEHGVDFARYIYRWHEAGRP